MVPVTINEKELAVMDKDRLWELFQKMKSTLEEMKQP